MRTFLSMVSLFLGVLAVVVVQAGAEVAENAAVADIELINGKDGNLRLNLPGDEKSIPIVLSTLKGRADAVATVTTSAVIGEPGVTPLNPGGGSFDESGWDGGGQGYSMICNATGCYGVPEEERGEKAPPAGQAIRVSLNAMTGDIRPFRPFRLRSGRWLDFGSEPSLAPSIVLNEAAAKGFSRYRIPAEMRVPGGSANMTPRVVGVVDDAGNQPAAYIRTDELLNWLPETELANPNLGIGMEVMLTSDAAAVERALRTRLTGAGIRGEQMNTERIQARRQIETELAIMRWVFLGMAAMVLLIGVAGILNVGLATVGERIEEFALRRAVGTSRSLLAAIVLAETLLTGFFTAAIAIGAAAGAMSVGVKLLAASHPSIADITFPWQAGFAGIIAGLVAGLLGGLIPAIRAARIPIATVMRA